MKALVVGAAHVDLFGDVEQEELQGDHIDKRGRIEISLGGTACNVATGLGFKGIDTYFITALPGKRLFSLLTRYCLKQTSLHWVVDPIEDSKLEPAFVSLRKNKDLFYAMSCCPIEKHFINPLYYEKFIKNSSAVVIDLNNSVDTVNAFIQKAEDRDIYILGVSEIKIEKLKALPTSKIKAVFMNLLEFNRVWNSSLMEKMTNTIWFITTKEGVWVFYKGQGTFFNYEIDSNSVKSFSGCGDAFAAGCISELISEKQKGVNVLSPRGFEFIINSGFSLVDLKSHFLGAQITGESEIEQTELLFRDALTGLYTRAFFEEEKYFINKFSERYLIPISVVLIDLDFFKKINDTYGHEAGDEVLKTVGHLISNNIRASDVAVRYGGEELLIVLPNTAIGGAKVVADKLRRKIEQTVVCWQDNVIRITASVGAAQAFSIEEAITLADKGLYKAKEEGRNRVCVYPSQKERNYAYL